jgi:hypothetical protein
MTEHERKADELERELEDMREQTERLDDRIGDTREDWRRKQRDDSVPGAVGDPGEDEDEDPPPEAQEPPGDEEDEAED